MSRLKRLSSSETEIVNNIYRGKGYKSKDICEALNLSASNFSRKLNGQIGITAAEALGLYNFLKKDQKLSFLKDYEIGKERILEPSSPPNIDCNDAWQGLYDSYTAKLYQVFQKGLIPDKTRILSGLEDLLEKESNK